MRLAALDVPQEVVAEAAPSLAPSISPGTSATVKVVVAGHDHAEVGDQRGERVVGDLGPGRGDGGDQRRLARAGEADQADVGDDLQLQA